MQNSDNSTTFTVNINENKIKCNKRICEMSTFLSNIIFLGMNTFQLGFQEQQNQEQQIPIQLIDVDTFKRFIEFCQINNYKQPFIPLPIATSNLEQVLDKNNYVFISKFQTRSMELIKLLKAAQFLGCKALQKVIAAKIACLIYFQDSKKAFQQKCKQLNIQSKIITAEDDQNYRKLYSSINNL